MTNPVVTRFAPSPTGILHIGGARTALFNWLFARHHGGQFRLRIEDTDRERSTPEATEAICAGLRWLGVAWDGEVISQSARVRRHQDVAHELLASGRAYRCYCSPEEIAEARKRAAATRTPFRFRSPWRDRDASEAPPNCAFAFRLRARRSGQTIVEDAVQGRVTWDNRELDDLVLLRSDGSPTYMLAVVVDDHDMGATHVIRGADHLTNAARQGQIYEALGWPKPVFAHIPLIHGPDGKKFSKRHGSIGLESFEADGYLPEAMRNYLARLGWAHGDDEFFSSEQAISWFTLEAVGRSAARFDFKKLLNLNATHMRSTPVGDLIECFYTYLARFQCIRLDDHRRTMLHKIFPELISRARTLSEMAEMARFVLVEGAPEPDSKARDVLSGDGAAILVALTPVLARFTVWEREGLEQVVRSFAEERSVSLGRVAQPVRAALTGRTTSPGIFEVMAVLGQEETLARLRASGRR